MNNKRRFPALQFFAVILLREADRNRKLLIRRMSDHLLLEARDKTVGTYFKVVAFGFTAFKRNSVHKPLVIDCYGVSVTYRTVIHGNQSRVSLKNSLDFSVNVILTGLVMVKGCLHPHIISELHLGLDGNSECILKSRLRANVENIHLGLRYDEEIMLLDGRSVTVIDNDVDCIVIESPFAVVLLNEMKGRFALPEARNLKTVLVLNE